MKVSIIGTGYVGLTTGVCLGYLGHKVTCIDSDEKKIALLQAGKTPIYEPFLTELMAEAQPNLTVLHRLFGRRQGCGCGFYCSGHTRLLPTASPDLCICRAAAQGIGQHFDRRFSGGGE